MKFKTKTPITNSTYIETASFVSRRPLNHAFRCSYTPPFLLLFRHVVTARTGCEFVLGEQRTCNLIKWANYINKFSEFIFYGG